ncbi:MULTISPECIES: copper amine oxidase N-terminal domain-containing protein [Paenibacillus]|uniref:copper amine oxidase N-terminal domain-containing protein n=1 Tax=Paenibacillus TaxID=44249 RepID=UPI0004130B88|nr:MULTISPECIES: copper amine oxidase N-terminal domain-containing protein [Paenibacillus]UMY55970.1 copper amine oxidase N-terminal domain-containing protein [Paenibacillus peoriae]
MRKAAMILLAVSVVCGAVVGTTLNTGETAVAANVTTNSTWKNAKIIDVIDRNNYILDDGSLWRKSIDGPAIEKLNLKGITGSKDKSQGYYGWTEDGKVAIWDDNSDPKVTAQSSGVKEITGEGLAIKTDGTISWGREQVEGISDAIDGDKVSTYFTVLTRSGDVWYSTGYAESKPRKIGHVDHALDIKMSTAYAAVLKEDGHVTMLDMLTNEPPREVGSDINSILWKKGTHVLITVHRDGTVWSYDRLKKYPAVQLSGLSNVARLVDSPDELFAQLKDGSWVGYKDGTTTALSLPTLTGMSLLTTSKEAAIGDTIQLNVQETYSNGYRLTRHPEASEIEVEKPQVAELQQNGSGTLKVRGIGSTAVSLRNEGIPSSFTLKVSSDQTLTGAAILNGSVYLPVQSVFKTLGGSVTVANQAFTIKLGKNNIVLQKGSSTAIVNGKPVALKGKVQTVNGQVVFPGTLLTDLKLGGFKWNRDRQQGELSVGATKLVIETPETAKIIKAIDLGSLSKLIGKTYWVNNFYNAGERFGKVTVRDIEVSTDPNGVKSYEVIFQGANGETYDTFSIIGASRIPQMLSDSDQFLTYDPYKKYQWSQAIWNKIKNNEVSLGMNTTQVQFAWGSPTVREKGAASNGTQVEAWVYGNRSLYFKAVAFVNGKVIEVWL